MAMSERRVTVAAEQPYDVWIGPGVRHRLAGLVGPWARVAVIYSATLATRAQALLAGRPGVHLICAPDAEAGKTPEVAVGCWRALAVAGLTRDDIVVGLGGGAITDLAGFIASTYLRGVAYIACPTTVLAMADAAVGGKTGVNLPEGKNLVGAFYEPRAVLCDLELLGGLPERETASGLVEIVKCGLIADGQITELIVRDPRDARRPDSERFAELLGRAVQVKADVVAQDLREQGVSGQIGREMLNYGHTLGHAIERDTGFTWRHGEAVSVGLVWASLVAQRLGLLTRAEADLHRRLLAALGLPITYPGSSWARLRAAMSLDKKARGTTLRLVLLEGLCRPVIRAGVDEAVLADAYSSLGAA